MYQDFYSDKIIRKLNKIKRRDSKQHEIVSKKMEQIISGIERDYKHLRHEKKGLQRVHLGHFVLIFILDEEKNTVSFEDYDHHDKIYKN